MVYGVGIIGFIVGFFTGQWMLLYMLKGRSNEEILNNKALKWQYGLMNWAMAALGAYIFSGLYRFYFP